MSRRKQSNPKSIKVSADSPEAGENDKDAEVRDGVHPDMEEDDAEDHHHQQHYYSSSSNNNSTKADMEEGEEEHEDDEERHTEDVHPDERRHHPKKTKKLPYASYPPSRRHPSHKSESADSPDHIDVVNSVSRHSPGPPHLRSSFSPSPSSPSSPPLSLNNHHYHHHLHHHYNTPKSDSRTSERFSPSSSIVVKIERDDDDDYADKNVDDNGDVGGRGSGGGRESERRDRDSVGSLGRLGDVRARYGSGSGRSRSALSPSAGQDNAATQGLVKHLQLPSDVLYLKEVEVTVHGTPTPSWMICSAIPLPKGSSLGPFSGHVVATDNIRVGNLILEFHSKTGHVVLVNVAGQSGAWLALLRPAVSELTRNALVYLEGGRIWCEVVSDVEIGMELRATFVFNMEDLSLGDSEMSTMMPTPPPPPAAAVDTSPSSQGHTSSAAAAVGDKAAASSSSRPSPPSSSSSTSSPTAATAAALSASAESSASSAAAVAALQQQQTAPGHAALIYGCPFCGVRFSSPRTLQGHLSYYCSKKKAQHIVTPRPPLPTRPRRTSDCQPPANNTPDMSAIKQEKDSSDSTTKTSSHHQAGENATCNNITTNNNTSSGNGIKRPATSSMSDNNNSSSNGSSNGDGDASSPPPAPKKARMEGGGVSGALPPSHQCPLCSYCTDKPNSLTRHMRIHNRPADHDVKGVNEGRSPAATGQSGVGSGVPGGGIATFCKECNIQFSSLSTFQCHKKHYCSQRNMARHASERKEDTSQFGLAAAAAAAAAAGATTIPPSLALGGGITAASLQLASLGQNGLLFPHGGHALPTADTAGGALPVSAALMPNGQPAMILTAPVMTPSGITSMAIPLSTMLQSTAMLQSIQQAAAAAATASGGVIAAAPPPPPPLSPPPPPQTPTPTPAPATTSPRKSTSPPKREDVSPRRTPSVPEEAHQSKSPKRTYGGGEVGGSKELPLDLSTKKSDTDAFAGSSSSSLPLQSERSIKKERDEEGASGSASLSGSSPRRRTNSGERGGGEDFSSSSTTTTTSPTNNTTPTHTPTTAAPILPQVHPHHPHHPHPHPHHLLPPPLLQPFLSLPPGLTPIPPVKHPAHLYGNVGGIPPGSSKCTDCNIIFYKHENYLIHKQHYCSERKKLRPVSGGGSGGGSSSLSSSSSVAAAASAASVAVPPAVSPRSADSAVKSEPSATITASTPESGRQSPVNSASPDKNSRGESTSVSSATNQPPALYRSPTNAVKQHPLPPLVTAASSGRVGGAEEVYYKFFCVPCKIKFSSASNLKAHKDYYCPHGKDSEHTIIAHRIGGEIISQGGGGGVVVGEMRPPSPGSHDSSSSPSPGQYCCPQCRGSFSSSRLLKLHLCSAEVSQASVMKCSHCDYVTHTDKRLAEHMKVHNPTSAYRCTLCGYRGNTVRGMRMHGKTHTDNGEDFTDEHMIEFQEPPLVPIQTNNDLKAVQGPFSMEAELLRLKNEPYKRRRSRKAYEKVDLLVPLDDPQSCHLCGECFQDHASLVDHLRWHNRQQQQPNMSLGLGHHPSPGDPVLLLPCPHCGMVLTSPHYLAAHLELAHGLPPSSSSSSITPREEKENLHPQPSSPSSPPSHPSLPPRSPRSSPPLHHERGQSSPSPPPGRGSPVVKVKEEPMDTDSQDPECEAARSSERHGGIADSHPTAEGSAMRETKEEEEGGGQEEEGGRAPSRDRSGSEDGLGAHHQEVDVENSCEEAQSSPPGDVTVKSESDADRDDDSYHDPPLPITFAAAPSSSSPHHSRSPHSDSLPSSPQQSALRDSPSTPPPPSTHNSPSHSPSTTATTAAASPPNSSAPHAHIKVEPDLLSHSSPGQVIFPPVFVPPVVVPSLIMGAPPVASSRPGERSSGAPYCKNCDISFTYHSTFVAHKKYYCTERNGLPHSASA